MFAKHSIFQAARVCVLGKGSDNLRGKGNEFIPTWEVNLSIPIDADIRIIKQL